VLCAVVVELELSVVDWAKTYPATTAKAADAPITVDLNGLMSGLLSK
jgi:hypothetical protein